jgi:trans-aconitate methyltransferase
VSKKSYQWNAQQYAQYSSAQYAWALELIAKLKLQGDETVLDIGCGDGKVTATIADRLPQGNVVGIDSSMEMIHLAKQKYADHARSRLMFHHLDVRELSDKNLFDVVFSNAVLHWIKNHPPILLRIQQAMKKSGRLLFQMGGQGNAAQVVAILDTLISGKWAAYFSGFSFPYGFHGPGAYSRWLVDAGLTPVRVDLIEKDMLHKGRDGLSGWIRSTWMPYVERVPESLRESFIENIVAEYLKAHPPDSEDVVHVLMKRLEVEAVKP